MQARKESKPVLKVNLGNSETWVFWGVAVTMLMQVCSSDTQSFVCFHLHEISDLSELR